MAAPTLEYNPSFTFQPSSPLDILVRKTSDASKSKNIYAAASLSRQARYPPSPSYTPHVDPSHRQAHQPPSPLLHTQFRGSTLSAATYDHHNSFLDTTVSTVGRHDSQEVKYHYSGDDDASVYSTPSMLPPPRNSGIIFPDYSTGRPGSWDEGNTPTAASIFIHTEPTPDTGGPCNGESTLESEQGDALPVPTVVITTAIEPASPALTPKRGGKTRIAAPLPKFNFSRPGRPPVLSLEDHKHQVIQRNAHRNRTQAMHPPTIPIPLINYAHPLFVPQHLQVPSARDLHILSQPDSTLSSSRGAKPHRPRVCNNGLSAGEDLHSSPAHLITNPYGGWLSRSIHPSPSPSSIPPTYQDDQSLVASGNTNHYGMPLPNANPKTTHLIPSDGGPPQPNAKPAPSIMPDTRASFARDRSPDRGRMSELGPDSQISFPTSQMSEASNQHSDYPPSKHSNSPTSTPKEPPRPPTSTTTHRPPKTSVELLREPPRAVSPAASVYSRYSFYQLDSTSPSPTGSTTRFSPRSPGSFPHSPRFLGPSDPSRLSPTHTREHQVGTRPSSPADTLSPTAPRTAQDYLQLGIQHHEANRLKDSAICFERSAKERGGCGAGMVMWGLSLRHGWGCEKDEARGFSWLQRAAEGAITDLESSRKGGLDTCGVQVRLSAFRSLHRC